MDRQTGRYIDTQLNKTDRQRYIFVNRQVGKQINRQLNRWIGKKVDRLIERQVSIKGRYLNSHRGKEIVKQIINKIDRVGKKIDS